jgi:hypothetical protein
VPIVIGLDHVTTRLVLLKSFKLGSSFDVGPLCNQGARQLTNIGCLLRRLVDRSSIESPRATLLTKLIGGGEGDGTGYSSSRYPLGR